MQYKITYINSINNEKDTLSTINSWLAMFEYIYLKSLHKQVYDVQIFKNDKDITEKVNKMIEKL